MNANKITNLTLRNVANDEKVVAVEVKKNPVYENNKPTGEYDGWRVTVVLPNNGYEKIAVKVVQSEVTDEMLKEGNTVWVTFTDFTAKVYVRENTALLSASAASCKLIADGKK